MKPGLFEEIASLLCETPPEAVQATIDEILEDPGERIPNALPVVLAASILLSENCCAASRGDRPRFVVDVNNAYRRINRRVWKKEFRTRFDVAGPKRPRPANVFEANWWADFCLFTGCDSAGTIGEYEWARKAF